MKISPATKPFHQRCSEYLIAVAPPASPLSGFGDFSENPPSAGRAWVAAGLACLTGDERALWLAQQLRLQPKQITPMRFLIAASLPLAQPKAISSKRLFAFPATGLAVYHSALQYPQHNVQWMLRASPLGNLSHSHCDQLGVVISAYGDPIFVNTGFRDYYDSPFCREWYWHTRSHNALLLGGEGQRRGPEATARLLRWDDSAAVVWAVADGTRAYSGLASRVERYVASVPSPNGHVIALLDDVETSAVNVIACWHTRQKPVLRPLASQLEVQTTNARVLVQFFSQAEIELSLTDRYSTEPSVVSHAAGSGRHEWHVGTNLTYPLHRRPRFQLATLVSLAPASSSRSRLAAHPSVSVWGDHVVLVWKEWFANAFKSRAVIFDTQAKSVNLVEGEKLPPSLQPPIPEARTAPWDYPANYLDAQSVPQISLLSYCP